MEQIAAPSRSLRNHFRMTVVPAVIVATLVIVTVVGALISPEGSGQLGGDFPAFFGAGSIVAEQGYDDLYDAATQRSAQEGLIENEGGYLFFAYPPFVATAYSWLAPLGYRVAYIIQMLVMWAAAAVAVLILRPVSATVDRYPLAVLAAVLLFQPLLAAAIGGQNTSLTMLLFAGAARAELSGRPLLAGLAVGLLAYKPQYGVPLALLVAVGGRWRVLVGTIATWLGLYLAGAAALGAGWIGPWWEQATAFRDTNATVNGHLFVSWPGFLEHISGIGGSAGRALGFLIGAAGLGVLGWLWRRSGVSAPQRYAAAAVGLVMVAPQSLFYEAGVAVIALIVLADIGRRARSLAVVTWLAGWVYAVSAPVLNTTVLVVGLTALAGFTFAAALGWRLAGSAGAAA